MSCERYRDALTDVAAGGPVPPGLGAHLASCEGCREELEGLRRALAIADGEMARLVADEPSPALAARIRQAVDARDAAPVLRFGWVWPAMAVATTLVVAFTVWATRAPSPGPRVAFDGRTPTVHTRDTGPPGGGGEPPGAAPAPSARRGSAVPPEKMTTEALGQIVTPRSASPTIRPERGRAGGSFGTRRGRVPRDGRPEVLVPRGEAEALVRFAAIVHRDRHTPGAFVATGRPAADLAEPAELVIEPLEIVPLDPAEAPGT